MEPVAPAGTAGGGRCRGGSSGSRRPRGDLERGTHSVLEHGYLVRVVRPHGLPEPTSRQAPVLAVSGTEYRDVAHDDLDLIVELDGTLHDATEARDADTDRDLDDLARGKVTPRLRYRQVFATPCRTASRLAVVFRDRGWDGAAHGCVALGCDLGEDRRDMSRATFPTRRAPGLGSSP